MGLVAYGKPIYKSKLLEIIDYNNSEINLKKNTLTISIQDLSQLIGTMEHLKF